MAKENISPEERLFKAIEKNKDSTVNKSVLKKHSFDFKELFLNLKTKIASFGTKKDKAEKRHFFDIFANLKIINRGLAIGSCFLLLFLVTDIAMTKRNHNNIFAETAGAESLQFQKNPITLLKDLSFYQEAAAKRDLFSPPARELAESLPGAGPKITELTKDLALVGIYWGTHPEAMLEDTEAKKTYFLKRGDTIKGLKIMNILKDRIILKYEGEEMEFM